MPDPKVMRDLEAINAEIVELELLEKRERVRKIKEEARAREVRQNQDRQKEMQLADQAKQTAYIQSICQHRKGGRDGEIWNGEKNEYAVTHHTYAHCKNATISCQRCGKEWWPPEILEWRKKQGYIAPDADLKKMAAEYAVAAKWPTDNTPSSGVTWTIPGVNAPLPSN